MKQLMILTAMIALVVPVMADTFGTGDNAFAIDFVPISGDAGNLGNWSAGAGYTFSGVNHGDYRMGTYEITNDQWTKFKANIAPTPVTGNPSSAYDEDPYFIYGTSVPTNCTSWYEAAQFVNYLNTSTGHTVAYKFTGTQSTLGVWQVGDTGFNSSNPYRNSNAFYFLPTENEWVKAAYWNGTYIQTYATKLGESLHQGDGTGGTGWNYDYNGYTNLYPWNVGSGSQELNGTYDMMGNVWEWMESPYTTGDYWSGSLRGLRGGNTYNYGNFLASSVRENSNAYDEGTYFGFRVASIPEPASLLLLGLGATMLRKKF